MAVDLYNSNLLGYYSRTPGGQSFALPLTIAGWFTPLTNLGAGHTLCALIANSTADYFELALVNSAGNYLTQLNTNTTAAGKITNQTTVGIASGSSGVWCHAAGVWTSATSRAVFFNGANKVTTPTTSVSPASIDSIDLGSWNYNACGAQAHTAIWNVALADGEILALARGINPLLVRPSALLAYWPMRDVASCGLNYAKAAVLDRTLTANGSPAEYTATAPPVGLWYPSSRIGWRGNFTRVAGLQAAPGTDAFWKAASDAATSDATGYTNIPSGLVAVSLIQVNPAAVLTASAFATASPAIDAGTLAQTQVLTAPALAAGAPALGTGALVQVHGLAALAASAGAPALDAPAANQKVAFAAAALAVASPVLSSGFVSQAGTMASVPLATGSPAIGTGTLAQTHAFLTLFEPQLSINPTVDLAFVRSPAGAAAITVTRASVAMVDDANGNWTTLPANVPRISNKGLLIEPAITNQHTNSARNGAVAGTPGTPPTFWAFSLQVGIAWQIVGVGTEANGVEYVDIRFSGVAATTGPSSINNPSTIASAAGQPWSTSAWVKLVGGSMAGLSAITLRCAGEAGGTTFTPDGNWTRITNSRVLSTGTTAQWVFRWNNLDTVTSTDFTIRIGWPQLENNALVSAPVRTTSAAVTKAADNVTLVSPPSPIPSSGGLFVEFALPRAAFAGVAGNFYLLQVSDGTANNRALAYLSWTNATAPKRFTVSNAASAQGDLGVNSTYAYNEAVSRIAGRFADNDMRAAVDGALSGVDNACIMPTNFTLLEIGKVGGASVGMWGYIRRVKYFNQPPTDNDLSLLTGGPGVSSPVLGQGLLQQKHVLVPVGITVASTAPPAADFAEGNVFDAVDVAASAPVLGTSTITHQGHALATPAFSASSPVLGAGTLKQKQVIVATAAVAGHVAFGSPVFFQAGTCVATPLVSSKPAFGVAGIKQIHALAAPRLSLSSGAVLGTPKAVIKAPPLFAANLAVASPTISPLRPTIGFVNIIASVPDFHVGKPEFAPPPDAELIAPPEVFFRAREKRWSRDPKAEFYDDDNTQFGAKVKQAIFTNVNDAMDLILSSGTLAGRTTAERGPAEDIIVGYPLWLEDKKLRVDWSEVDQLRDDVNALMAAVTSNTDSIVANTAALAAATAQQAINVAAIAANTALLAALMSDVQKLLRQLKIFIPRDLVAGAPILGTPRAATRLPAATNVAVASPVLGKPVLVRIV